MRTYLYQFILENLDIGGKFTYYQRGINKADALNKIDLLIPCKVLSCKRVNVNKGDINP